jgi:hypothetical protein
MTRFWSFRWVQYFISVFRGLIINCLLINWIIIVKHVTSIESNCHKTEGYGEGLMKINVRKWWKVCRWSNKASMVVITLIGPAYDGWMSMQHKRKHWFRKTDVSQFQIYPLLWGYPLKSVHKWYWMQEPDFQHDRSFKLVPRWDK